jgi:hypothetical protein
VAARDEKSGTGKAPATGSPARGNAEHTSVGGGRRSSKELVRWTAKQALDLGWERPKDFNIVVAYGDTVWMLYQELAAWTRQSVSGRSRGDRRLARRLAHAVANGLRDLKQDAARIEAVEAGETKLLLVSGMFDIPEVEPDPTALAMRVAWHRFRMALGAEKLSTQTRAVLQIRALDRIGNRLDKYGILPPIARVRERAARPYAPRASDEREESVREGSSVPDSEAEEGVEPSEARGEGGTARSTEAGGADDRARNKSYGDAMRETSGWD